MKSLYLLDADIPVFKASIIAQQVNPFSGEVDDANIEMALDSLKEQLEPYLKLGKVILCFSEGKSFRYDILETYKHNRKNSEKPILLGEVREHCLKNYRTLRFDGLEGDDVCGIFATKPEVKEKYDVTIVSDDKDLKTVPCKLIRLNNPVEEITPQQAHYYHMYQTLVGDPTDGYSGCPQWGDKKVTKLLTQPLRLRDNETLWGRVCDTFYSKGLTKNDALTQARLAKILTWDLWDSSNKKPKMWEYQNNGHIPTIHSSEPLRKVDT